MTTQPHTLLLESISPQAHLLLDQETQVLEAFDPSKALDLAKEHPIEAIVTRGKGRVQTPLISACESLKVIARCGVGLDNIHVVAASARSIPVINLPGSNADTVAEHTLALMLCLQRRLYPSIAAVKRLHWSYRNEYQGDEIRGKTLGILGLGHIGSKVAQLATAFGMQVVYWGSQIKNQAPYNYLGLKDLLSASDIVSIHLPLVESTTNLLNKETLGYMPNGSLLINTSRGAIINESALIESLKKNHLAGYAADVLLTEPPPQNYPLLDMDQVLITPHSASLTRRTYDEMCLVSVQNVLRLISGNTIDNSFIFNSNDL